MKGDASLHMRCLHCGKRLSLLRKFSDGEFCSAEHRSLFNRLNNDLGLQRLFASRLRQESAPAEREQRTETHSSARIPPLGDLVKAAPPSPVVVRRVNLPGAPLLLGPKDSEIPEPAFRARYRGLGGQDEAGWASLEVKPFAPPPPRTPNPIPPSMEIALAEPRPAETAPDAQSDPALLECLLAVGSSTPLACAAVGAAPGVTVPLWTGARPQAPLAGLRLCAPESPGGRNGAVAPEAAEPAAISRLLPLKACTPAIRPRAGSAGAAGCCFTAERRPEPPASGLKAVRAGLLHPGRLYSAPAVHDLPAGRTELALNPLASTGDPCLPSLGLRPQTTSWPPARGILLTETTALWPPEVRTASIGASAGALLVNAALSLPRPGRAPAGEPVPKACGPAPLGLAPADVLQVWRTPMAAPAPPPLEIVLPRAALEPVLLTVEEALEAELASTAETETQPPEAAEPAAPPFQDALRRLPIQRPLARAAVVSSLPEGALAPAWKRALEASAFCPAARLRLDHADGSGSRSIRPDARAKSSRARLRGVHEKIPGSRFWRNAPADLKWIALALPIILALVVWSFRGSVAPVEASLPQQPDASKTVLAKQLVRLQQVLLSRAAVRLYDDFRGGLSAWNGKEGWARTWKYSDASFLEPGDLAIYTPTAEMRDYTVEFLGQIERRSLNWVFRAKDLQNYYAMRIVITRTGPLPAAALVRYAVKIGRASCRERV